MVSGDFLTGGDDNGGLAEDARRAMEAFRGLSEALAGLDSYTEPTYESGRRLPLSCAGGQDTLWNYILEAVFFIAEDDPESSLEARSYLLPKGEGSPGDFVESLTYDTDEVPADIKKLVGALERGIEEDKTGDRHARVLDFSDRTSTVLYGTKGGVNHLMTQEILNKIPDNS